jgi:peptidoglycan hydrolase-like protein with peptidoglycan-binding domain
VNQTSTWGSYGNWSSWSTTPVSASDSTEVQTKTETYTPDNPGEPYAYPGSTICNIGSRGDAVRWYQKFANEQWGAGLVFDGIYGYNTCNFIKSFQQAYGLTVDGAAGPKTAAKMLEVWKERTTTTTTYYSYRTRSKTTTYYYEKWSAWSEWSTTPAYSSDTKNVETKEEYIY